MQDKSTVPVPSVIPFFGKAQARNQPLRRPHSKPPRGFDGTTTVVVSRLSPPRKRSEGETTTDCRSKVAVVEIGDSGAMRNGDGQTAGHEGICKSRETVEPLGEVMIEIERSLFEDARAGTAEAGGDGAGRWNTEGVLRLPIPGESDVGFAVVSVFHAGPPDLHLLFGIKIVVFDPAHAVT